MDENDKGFFIGASSSVCMNPQVSKNKYCKKYKKLFHPRNGFERFSSNSNLLPPKHPKLYGTAPLPQ